MNSRRKKKEVQLTVRGVPAAVKTQLSKRAAQEGRSLNKILVDALTDASGVASGNIVRRDLSGLAGSWVEDREFDDAIRAQRAIDESLWQ